MPELPEVETVARQLSPLVAGQVVRQVRIIDHKLANSGLELLRGKRILKVTRLGKQVLIDLTAGRRKTPLLYLGVHLRMTGRLLFAPDTAISSLSPLPHNRVSFSLSRGRLDFCDVRRFGTMRVAKERDVFAPAGLDPTAREFTSKRLRQLLGTSSQEIKVWLLRQDKIVGIGNIYASEILFAARISPFQPVWSLSQGEISRLHRQTRRVLNKAIRFCGTTFSDFQDATGRSGGFARFLQVYGRPGEPCKRCGTAIERAVQQGRATFFCRSCQPRS